MSSQGLARRPVSSQEQQMINFAPNQIRPSQTIQDNNRAQVYEKLKKKMNA